MAATRKQVSIHRQQLAVSVVGAILIVFLVRVMVDSIGHEASEPYDLLLQMPLSNYPSWIANGWLPLDITVAILMIYPLMGFGHLLDPSKEPDTLAKQVRLFAMMISVLGGGFAGIAAVATSGWYTGIGAYILGGLAAWALVLGFAAFAGIMFGIGWLVREGYRRYAAHIVGPLVAPLKKYFEAEDVPDDTDDGPAPPQHS